MTDKPEQRDAQTDLELCNKTPGDKWTQQGHAVLLGKQALVFATIHAAPSTLELMAVSKVALPYWINEAESRLIRTEAAEQELNKLQEDNMWMQSMLGSIRDQVNVLNVLDKGKKFKEVIDRLYFQIDVSLNREKYLTEDQLDRE